MLALLLTAVALSMDSVAVSISIAMSRAAVTSSQSLKLAAVFAFFQAAMPWLGYVIGNSFQRHIVDYDHWVAFGLLSLLGVKMIIESFEDNETKLARQAQSFSLRQLSLLGIVTSVDALVVGLSFSLLQVDLIKATLAIAATTFILCLAAIHLGRKLGTVFANRAELLGGLVLIGLGAKILYEHLVL